MKTNKEIIYKLKCLKFNMKDEGDKNKESIKMLLEKETPFVITDSNIMNKPEGLSSENIIRMILDDRLKVSAAVDNVFSGTALEHSQIEMNLDEYFHYKGGLNLYISQINLLGYKDLENIISFKKLEILRYILFLIIFSKDKFSKVNIWHSFKPTISKFHYDAYENFLYVIRGRKIVLLSPNNSNFIIPCKLGENTGNQAERITYKYRIKKLNKIKKLSYNLQIKSLSSIEEYKKIIENISQRYIIQVEICANEILYIPEGWWHQVYTFGYDNLAFNFWWEKTNKLLLNNKEHFLIKQSISSLVDKKIKEIGSKRKHSNKLSINLLQKIVNENKHSELIQKVFDSTNSYKDYCNLYYEFESSTNSDSLFFNKFWEVLNMYNKSEDFLNLFNTMKRTLCENIINKLNLF